MRAGTLTRIRLFRADADLDAALAAGAERAGVSVSAFLRRAVRSALNSSDDPPPPPAAPAVTLPLAA
ncbi:ribbon-helix-helix protein, CopG family [Methylobacterium sp. NEAU 140]|uniref:ribbon-helix-helix protein, CopG family n=1 Tax=Methylobacterium sp. NEAU 140 TaxID=3064945 RepID=UPI00273277CD|nr:ribbon-helix-helix protein, CopG family [Methylobacterium sp. NEAU 140]MDP4026337.1 ribbon-helix-helix protein, CopG family [Methylobacterium sp. NEAU 140]